MIDRFRRAYCDWLHHLGIYDDAFLFWLPWGLTLMILCVWYYMHYLSGTGDLMASRAVAPGRLVP